jgi:ABC-2 type transport system permease protein
MIRAFRSELTKLRRWSVLVGGTLMIVITVLVGYFALTQVAAGVSAGSMLAPLVPALRTTQGLVTLVGGADYLVTAIAIMIVAANVAMEWSQGTIRNLLVREPGRLRLLAGKMLALLLFVVLCEAVALLAGAGISLVVAQSHGISTAPWTGAQGVSTFFSFFGNRLLSIVGVSLLGMCVAVLTRSTGAAVGISLAYVLAADPLINLVWQAGNEWLPARLFNDYLTGVDGVPPMGYSSALVVALLWIIGFVLVGAAVFRLRDVTA